MFAQAEIRNKKILSKEICEFGAGRPDFGARWSRGDALGPKEIQKRVAGLGLHGVHAQGTLSAPGHGERGERFSYY